MRIAGKKQLLQIYQNNVELLKQIIYWFSCRFGLQLGSLMFMVEIKIESARQANKPANINEEPHDALNQSRKSWPNDSTIKPETRNVRPRFLWNRSQLVQMR